MNEFPLEMVDLINQRLGGYNDTLGLRFVKAAHDEFVSEITITEDHHQPYGLVHGGLYCSMVETTCSTAAALNVFGEGKSAVGLENSTSFLRSVRSGTIRCTATPLVQGRRSHVWEARIRDEEDRIVATGRVRMLILEAGAQAGGEKVEMKS
jgi:1,4-dihydroxy-2-naphthoyl-CoA hydrolase